MWRPSDAETRLLSPEDFARLGSRFGEVNRYLLEKAGSKRLPSRQDFDPLDFPRLLGFFNIASVHRGGGRLRFRFDLVGTEQTAVSGREVTGMFVEDAVIAAAVDLVNSNMTLAVTEQRPVYSRFYMPQPDHEFTVSERVYFPLADNGETVDRLLILYDYLSPKRDFDDQAS